MASQPHQRLQHNGVTVTMAVRKDPTTGYWYNDVEDIQDHFPGVNKFMIDDVTLVFLKDGAGQRYTPGRLDHYPNAIITALVKDVPVMPIPSQSATIAGKQPAQSPGNVGLVSIAAAAGVVEATKDPVREKSAGNLQLLIQKTRDIISLPNKELFENPFSRFFIIIQGQLEGKDHSLVWFLCKTPRMANKEAPKKYSLAPRRQWVEPERHLIHVNHSAAFYVLVEEEEFLDRYALYMLGLTSYLIEDLSEGGDAEDPVLAQATVLVVELEKSRETLLKAMMAKKLSSATPPITIPLDPAPTSTSTSSFASISTTQSSTKEKKGFKNLFSKLSTRSTSSASSITSTANLSKASVPSQSSVPRQTGKKIRAEDIVLSEQDRQELIKIAADNIRPLEGRALREVATFMKGANPFNPLELPFCDLYRLTAPWGKPTVEWLCERHHLECRGSAMINKDHTDPYEFLKNWEDGMVAKYTPEQSKLTMVLRHDTFLSEDILGPVLTPNPSTIPVESDTKIAAIVVEELRIKMPATERYSADSLKALVQIIAKSSVRYLTLTFQDVMKSEPDPRDIRQNEQGKRYDALAGLFTNRNLVSIEISGVEMFGLQTNNWAFPPESCESLRSFKFGSVIIPSDQTVLTTLFNQAFPRTLIELKLGERRVSRISTPLANAMTKFRHLEVLHLHSVENVLNYGPLPSLTKLTSLSEGGPYYPKSALRELDIVIAPFEQDQFEQLIGPVRHQLETLVVLQNGFVPYRLNLLASPPPSGLESDLVLFPFLTNLHLCLPGASTRNVKMTSLVLSRVTNQLLYLGLLFEKTRTSKEMNTVLSAVANAGAKRLHRLYLQGFHAHDMHPIWSIFPANGGISPIHTLALEDVLDPKMILPAQLAKIDLIQLWLGWLERHESGLPVSDNWLIKLLPKLSLKSLLTLSIMKCGFSQKSFDILWNDRLSEFRPALKINLGYFASEEDNPCEETDEDLLIFDLVQRYGGDRFYGGGLFGHNLNTWNSVFLRRELIGY